MDDFDPRLKESVDFVASYVGDIDDWNTVKKEIMKSLPWQMRTNFSNKKNRLDGDSKFNAFEAMIIEYWGACTGIVLKA